MPNQFIGTSGELGNMVFYFIFVDLYGCVRLLTQICPTLPTLYHSNIPLRLIKRKLAKTNKKKTQSRFIRLIKVVFSKGTILSVSDKSKSVNECTHTDQQKIYFHILGVYRKAEN